MVFPAVRRLLDTSATTNSPRQSRDNHAQLTIEAVVKDHYYFG
jgi:hypothetical protein